MSMPFDEGPKLAARTQFLESSLARQLGWIAAADAKTGVIFAVAIAMVGFVAATAPKYGSWTSWGVACGLVAAFLLVASLSALTMAIIPRDNGPSLSLVFFGGVAGQNLDEYRRALMKFDDEALAEDLIQQTHANATIAARKYRWIKYATWLLYVSVVPWIAAIFLLFRDKQ